MINKKIVIIIVLLAITSCSKANYSPPSSDESLATIVFVPGFKGSELIDKESGKKIWLTAQGAFFDNETLVINEKQLIVGSVVEQINIIPGAYSFSVYGPFLDWLRTTFPDTTVIPFAYDWRKSVDTNAKKLDLFLNKLKSKKIIIVSHSLGSLITSYYLRYGGQEIDSAKTTWEGAKKVDAVILSTTPFLGTLSIFHDLQRGIKTGLNRSLLSAAALQTFPVSYQLLPQQDDAIINKETLSPTRNVSLEESLWSNCNWGLLEKNRDVALSSLKKAKKLMSLIHRPSTNILTKPLPTLVLKGIAQKTHARTLWSGPPCGKFRFFKPGIELLYEDGDGLLTKESQTLPRGFSNVLEAQSIKVPAEHLALLTTEKSQRAISEFIKHLIELEHLK